jgi:hypothetical protein
MENLNPTRTIDYVIALIQHGRIDRARALTRDPHIDEIVTANSVQWLGKRVDIPDFTPVRTPPQNKPYNKGDVIDAQKVTLNTTRSSPDALKARGLTPVADHTWYGGLTPVESGENVEYAAGKLVAKAYIAPGNPLRILSHDPHPTTTTRQLVRVALELPTAAWDGHSVKPPPIAPYPHSDTILPSWWPCWDPAAISPTTPTSVANSSKK